MREKHVGIGCWWVRDLFSKLKDSDRKLTDSTVSKIYYLFLMFIPRFLGIQNSLTVIKIANFNFCNTKESATSAKEIKFSINSIGPKVRAPQVCT